VDWHCRLFAMISLSPPRVPRRPCLLASRSTYESRAAPSQKQKVCFGSTTQDSDFRNCPLKFGWASTRACCSAGGLNSTPWDATIEPMFNPGLVRARVAATGLFALLARLFHGLLQGVQKSIGLPTYIEFDFDQPEARLLSDLF
jgi:hypothetical protein